MNTFLLRNRKTPHPQRAWTYGVMESIYATSGRVPRKGLNGLVLWTVAAFALLVFGVLR